MPLPIITRDDLRRALEDTLQAGANLDDLRDARKCATVLAPEDCQLAILDALRNVGVRIRAEVPR